MELKRDSYTECILWAEDMVSMGSRYHFDAAKEKEGCIQYIKDFFSDKGDDSVAVVGISGGKDSTIVAALCIEALGVERVIGVLLPTMTWVHTPAEEVVGCLEMNAYIHYIKNTVDGIYNDMRSALMIGNVKPIEKISRQSIINTPARVRMNILRSYAQQFNGYVANTCNASENYIGYSTVDGDASGDFSPLHAMTVTEVKGIGYQIKKIPKHLVDIAPADGLCGKTDEDNLGFTYAVLDRYIRTGVCEDLEIKKKIDTMHEKNLFKLLPMSYYKPNLYI